MQKMPAGHPRLGGPERPALVTHARKPQAAWNQDDYDFMEAHEQLPPGERQELLEPYLVETWDELQLDPRVWGIVQRDGSEVSLLGMSVKDARLQLTHRLLQRHRRDRDTACCKDTASLATARRGPRGRRHGE